MIVDPADFIGGAELFNIDLVNNISKRYPDIKIDIIFNGNTDYKTKLHTSIKTISLPFPKLKRTGLKGIYNLYKISKSIKQIVKTNKYDIIQSNTVRAHIASSIVSQNNKLFWFIHDFTLPKKIIKLFSRIPTHIFCCSKIVKEYVIKTVGKTHKDKISIVYNGIDINKKLFRPKNKIKRVGIAGRIDRWKGQKYFILAAIEILKINKNVSFHIYGEPNIHNKNTIEYFSELKTLISNHHLEGKITLEGYKKNIMRSLNELDVFVHCSTEEEPFGRVIIEAMSLSKPVVASDIGGPLEIIKDNVNGLLINPKDTVNLAKSINLLLQDEEKANKISKEAKKTIEKRFELNNIVDQVVNKWEKYSN